MLLADRRTDAESTVTLFTKDPDNSNNLFDMQCMWYETECGASYLRQGHLRMALKNFHYIEKHFD
jgi:peptide alpha-N-acetyltransferase